MTSLDGERERQAALEPAGAAAIDAVREHWRTSWETALTALASATVARALATPEAEAHRVLIAAERELVTRELHLLVFERALERAPA